MILLLASALVTAAPDPTGPSMSAWAACMGSYVRPRLAQGSTEQIVDGSFAACRKSEDAARKAWESYAGPNVFVGIKYKVRQVMLRRVAQGKQLRGLR